MLPKGPAENSVTDDDPYEFIYHNLPQRHKLRQVSDCSYCGASFSTRHPGFVVEKEKYKYIFQRFLQN